MKPWMYWALGAVAVGGYYLIRQQAAVEGTEVATIEDEKAATALADGAPATPERRRKLRRMCKRMSRSEDYRRRVFERLGRQKFRRLRQRCREIVGVDFAVPEAVAEVSEVPASVIQLEMLEVPVTSPFGNVEYVIDYPDF